MKTKDLRELTTDELQMRHDELWKDLFGMRIKHTLGQLENPLRLRDTRRHIARVKTLLSERGVKEVARRRVAGAGAPAAGKTKVKAKQTKKAAAARSAGSATE
jgi:large subunit ribosomal protein L29